MWTYGSGASDLVLSPKYWYGDEFRERKRKGYIYIYLVEKN
jgi:hypothetical protein